MVEKAPYGIFSRVITAVGRITPQGVSLLGTAFILNRKGWLATTAHVTGRSDQNLVVLLPKVGDLNNYQDTSDKTVQSIQAKIERIDPFRDICILSIPHETSVNIPIRGLDHVEIGENITTFGFPHADQGRMVLTFQRTEIGAKILLESGRIKSKHAVLNIQARPGQSGSPVFSEKDFSLIGILIGSYAPGGGGGISLGGVDPHTLHQTTHAVSAEYLHEMIND